MAKKNQNVNGVKSGADYWLGKDFSLIPMSGKSPDDVIKLASYKKAIGNFVNIVTSRNDIKVKYSVGNQSYTDGKSVVLSAKFNTVDDFNVAVGLALHEGSHCLLSDFEVLSIIKPFIPWQHSDENALRKFLSDFRLNEYIYDVYSKKIRDWRYSSPATFSPTERRYRESVLNYLSGQIVVFKNIINIVEDRRIDRYVLDTAPGYTAYYDALYARYFSGRSIDQMFNSNVIKKVEWSSYMFCLLNIMNSNFNTKILPNLDKISDALDLKNIDRLKTTNDSIDVAKIIFKIIADTVPMPEFDQSKPNPADSNNSDSTPQPKKNNGSESDENDEDLDNVPNSSSSDSENGESGNRSDSNSDAESDESAAESDESAAESDESAAESDESAAESDESNDESDESNDEGDESNDEGDESNDEGIREYKESQTLTKILNKQQDFSNGRVKKTGVRREISPLIEAASETDSEYVELKDLNVKNVKVLVARGISEPIIKSKLFKHHITHTPTDSQRKAIEDGMRLGTLLGKRLKTRDEDRTLKSTRLQHGKIDRRLIAELGFNNAKVFQSISHSTSKPAAIHISIDASGSMAGQKWYKTLTAAIAIAKAADSVQSIDCSISIRGNYDTNTPLMWVVYDSRKDKLQNFKVLAGHLDCNASTPEGLCFEAIRNEIISFSKGKDAFFINLSDGEPAFMIPYRIRYDGAFAAEHTKKQVTAFRAAGIQCLSYFISTHVIYDYSKQLFQVMYGDNASFINVTNLIDLTKTINLMFERKIS